MNLREEHYRGFNGRFDGNFDVVVTHLWNPITPRNPEDGDNMFSETSVGTSAIWYNIQKASIIDTAVKASQKTVIFYLK
jgi:hypothetical protein